MKPITLTAAALLALSGCTAVGELIIPPTDLELAEADCDATGIPRTAPSYEACVQAYLADLQRQREVAEASQG
ncbi:hypothetical protein AADZ90_006575 [Aestuariibius sp. 2305UL40-4]|uniref:hypothetical protein n=1 Tax=Aestuariibius violaceus TaxID=3234132 RepID=UPI00345E25A3